MNANLKQPLAAIIDFGMGNLYSVARACQVVGLTPVITSSPSQVNEADAVILPGVGAFESAMEYLREYHLIESIEQVIQQKKPFLGICLGLQLLMTESYEFGKHRGLDIIQGSVIRFENKSGKNGRLKVPHIGWSSIFCPKREETWKNSPLSRLKNGTHMYFVHSYYVVPSQSSIIGSLSCYGDIEFCSSVKGENLFGCQFHPERSGPLGLAIYQDWATLVRKVSGKG